MGKKKSNKQHVQQSMGQMVSKAALAQLGPHIQRYVDNQIQSLGSNLAQQTANTMTSMFTRIVVLEELLIEKLGISKEELVTRLADLEDTREGLKLVNGPAEKNDVVRVEIQTKTKDQKEFQGSSKLRITELGTGQTLGEIEQAMLGMSAGETKETEFGLNKELVAKITMNRVSRGEDKSTDEGVEESTRGLVATEEDQNAESNSQG